MGFGSLGRLYSAKFQVESVYGDGGTTGGFLPLFIDSLPSINPTFIENPAFFGSLERPTAYLGKISQELKGKFFLKGSSAAGTPPELAPIFKAAGLGETVVASTSVTYSPIDSSQASYGVLVKTNDNLHTINGSRIESLSIPFVAGEQVQAEFTLKGLFSARSHTAFVTPTFSDGAIVPPRATQMAILIGGVPYIIPKLTLEIKNILNEIDSLNAANTTGVNGFDIVGREFGGTFTVIRNGNNDTTFETYLTDPIEPVVTSTGMGPAGGNLIGVSLNNMQITDIKLANYQGEHAYDVTFRINRASSLANEFSLFFK
jgi:hypothetical protein